MLNNKEKLRNKYAEIRRNLSSEYINKNQPIITKKVIDYIKKHHAKLITIYYPIIDQNEVNTKDVIQYCFENNIKVYLPRWANLNMDFYQITSFDDLEKVHQFYMPKPQLNELTDEQIDIAFIPLVAFDKDLNRLGYGKGYYDRWIANNENYINQLVGIGWKAQLSDELIPKELNDKPLNWVIIN